MFILARKTTDSHYLECTLINISNRLTMFASTYMYTSDVVKTLLDCWQHMKVKQVAKYVFWYFISKPVQALTHLEKVIKNWNHRSFSFGNDAFYIDNKITLCRKNDNVIIAIAATTKLLEHHCRNTFSDIAILINYSLLSNTD